MRHIAPTKTEREGGIRRRVEVVGSYEGHMHGKRTKGFRGERGREERNEDS